MQKIKAFLKNKWFLHSLGLLAVAIIIWFLGPLIAVADVYFLSSISSRLLLIVVVVFLWSANQVRLLLKAKANNDQLIEEMSSENKEFATAEETAVIKERFQQALDVLKSSSKKQRGETYLYELPWYIIIGPPGSGKTTALLNSGLEFPLEDKIGMEAVKGIGGTRHCDWWFTKEAILIDTAGRFTTQDSDASVDKAAWVSFMDMLKKYRKQRPINGAMIAMSVSDMMTMSEDERSFYAKTIRKRLEELSQYLKIDFPVYFMFSKCDLISGFNEFFSRLDAGQSAQVWGHTFELNLKGKNDFDIDALNAAYGELVAILKQQVTSKVNVENDPIKKAGILSFPSQFESLQPHVAQFLNDIFASNRFKQGSLLRGVYFTSGTQQGTPFDQLLGNMAEGMGIAKDEGILYSGKGRSFFIRKLLSDVVFAEADMAGVDQKLKRLMKRLQYASLTTAVISFVAISIIWLTSYQENTQRISAIDENLMQLEDIAYDRPTMQGARFKEVLAELDLVLSTTQTFDEKTFADHFGLNQESTYRNQLDNFYADALSDKYLPVLAGRLEELIALAISENDLPLLFDLLKAYLMYAGVNEKSDVPAEPQWLEQLFTVDWHTTFVGETDVISQLIQHHKNLWASNFVPIKEDKQLVARARQTLLRMPLEEQVYLHVKQELLADSSNDLMFRDIAGSTGFLAFRSRAGRDLNSTYIPGLFTKTGFYNDFVLQSAVKSDEYLNNYWVLGEHNKQNVNINESALQEDLYKYYYRDFIATWGELLRDLTLIQPENNQIGVSLLERVSEINGPLESLIYAVAEETDLSSPVSSDVDTQAVSEVAGVVNGKAQRAISRANQLARRAEKMGLENKLGIPVNQHFEKYRRLVASGRSEAPITKLLRDSQNFALFINQTLFDGFGDSAAFEVVNNRLNNLGIDPFASLNSNKSGTPNEVRDWLDSIADIGWTMLLQKTKNELNEIWKRDVLDFYQSALEGKYPIYTKAAQEMELRDFTAFFRPDGIFEQYVKDYVEPFVNLRTGTWSSKTIDGHKLEFSPGVLNQLRIAHKVKELFFQGGKLEPGIRFSITPESLSANAGKINLTLGEQNIEYAHGPRIPRALSWPFNAGRDSVRLSFTSLQGMVASESETGPWSLFKILDKHTLKATQQNSVYFVDFASDGFKASFELRADTEFNPIGERILQSLDLPKEL